MKTNTCIHKQNDAIYHILETETQYLIITVLTMLMLRKLAINWFKLFFHTHALNLIQWPSHAGYFHCIKTNDLFSE